MTALSGREYTIDLRCDCIMVRARQERVQFCIYSVLKVTTGSGWLSADDALSFKLLLESDEMKFREIAVGTRY